MIIFEDKNMHQNSLYPDSDWTGKAKWVIPDENTELCAKVFEYCPYFEVIEDEEGNITDIIKASEPIEVLKSNKITEMSAVCQSAITDGFDYEGKHYSLSLYDQINLERIKNSITEATTSVKYHADGECEEEISVETFNGIYNAATNHIESNTARFNNLKGMIKNLSKEEEVKVCYYGMKLDTIKTTNKLNVLTKEDNYGSIENKQNKELA